MSLIVDAGRGAQGCGQWAKPLADRERGLCLAGTGHCFANKEHEPQPSVADGRPFWSLFLREPCFSIYHISQESLTFILPSTQQDEDTMSLTLADRPWRQGHSEFPKPETGEGRESEIKTESVCTWEPLRTSPASVMTPRFWWGLRRARQPTSSCLCLSTVPVQQGAVKTRPLLIHTHTHTHTHTHIYIHTHTHIERENSSN